MRKILSRVVPAALLLLSACVQYTPLSEGASFDATKGTAIVVMGVDIDSISEDEGSGFGAAIASLRGDWRAYDPATGRLLGERNVATFTLDDGGGFFGFEERFQSTEYVVFEVNPGSYILAQTTKGVVLAPNYNRLLRHHYLDTEEEPPSYGYPEATAIGESVAPRFTVSAGDVVYLGDFRFSGSARRTPIIEIQPNTDAARAYMRREFPDISTPVEHQPPSLRS